MRKIIGPKKVTPRVDGRKFIATAPASINYRHEDHVRELLNTEREREREKNKTGNARVRLFEKSLEATR